MTRTHRAAVSLRIALTFALMTLVALAMLLVSVLTLFRSRRFNAEVLGAWLGRTTLRLWGIRLVVHREAPVPDGQVIWLANHTSTLDAFVLIALALPRTRFFMIGWLRKILPLALIGYLIGMIWTVQQHYPERRRRIFQRADRLLRRTGDSAYLSPEGMRVTTGEIGHFNKGAFHLATSLRAPIVPLYIRIPPAIDPGLGYRAASGTVDVFFLPAIDTSAWRLEDLERNRDAVRELYVTAHERLRWRPEREGPASTAPPELVPGDSGPATFRRGELVETEVSR